MSNVMSTDIRALSDAEIDTVAGGNPWAFAAGVVVGGALTVGVAAVAVGGKYLYDKMTEDQGATMAPGTDENGNPVDENGNPVGGNNNDNG